MTPVELIAATIAGLDAGDDPATTRGRLVDLQSMFAPTGTSTTGGEYPVYDPGDLAGQPLASNVPGALVLDDGALRFVPIETSPAAEPAPLP